MKNFLFIFIICLFSASAFCQEPEKGNLIPGYGVSYPIEDPDFRTDTTATYRLVFDISTDFGTENTNRLFEIVARFLNMHEKAGVPAENMKVAMVIHGTAIFDILKDEYYSDSKKIEKNPNSELLSELARNKVQIIACGQSAFHNNLKPEMFHKEVKIALSAMTALVQLQNEDYKLINFN